MFNVCLPLCNYKILPILLVILMFLNFISKNLGLFDFIYRIYKDKQDNRQKQFKEVEERHKITEERIKDLHYLLIELQKLTKSSQYSQVNTGEYFDRIDKFFNDLVMICDGINKKCINPIFLYDRLVLYDIMKKKYDINDNLIIDCFNALKKIQPKMKENIDINRYKPILIYYKKRLPLYKRALGFVFKKFLIIN